MNDIQSIHIQYSKICELINGRRLKEAVTQLNSFLFDLQNWELNNQLEQISTSYTYMLQYMRQGINDPERHRLYQKLLRDLREIAEQAHIQQLDRISSSYYHESRRNKAADSQSLEKTLQILESFNDDLAVSKLISNDLDSVLKRHEENQRIWFQHLWTSAQWTSKEEQTMQSALQDASLTDTDLALTVGAVTLSLTQCWDVRKMMWLIDVYEKKTPIIASQRALVGIILSLFLHPELQKFYPEVKDRLLLLNEQTPLDEDILQVYKQLLLCQETDNIDRQMREEILPEMLKNIKDMKDLKFNMEESDEDDDFNPDWEKMMNNEQLENRMRQMSELQMEGADVYMSTFAQLKTFPFFYSIHNWFLPFDPNQSVVRGKLNTETQQNSVLSLIMSSGFFCNSDKYSLLLMLNNFPQSQQEMIFSQLSDQQMEMLSEQPKTESLKKISERPTTLVNQYLHDLYRFYKLNTHRKDFQNPFEQELRLEEKPVLSELLQNNDLLLTLAEYHLKKEHWKAAMDLLSLILSNPGELRQRPDLYQKLGYSQQKLKQYSLAIDSYLKADTIQPDSSWTCQHLATCYRITRQYEQALSCYHKLESKKPENTPIIYHIASCLAELGQYEESLKYFFKLNYLENDSMKSQRGIAWCSFVCGKNEQAQEFYDKILAGKPVAVDYLNTGHLAWVTGKISQAADLYTKAYAACSSGNEFIEMFNNDRTTLIEKGIPEEDIPLMLDLLS